MKEIVVVTREELEEIIINCITRTLIRHLEPDKQSEQMFLYSIRELADLLGCSTVTAQRLKNSGRIRYKQYGRKLIFKASEVLEDLDKKLLKNKNRRICLRSLPKIDDN